mgnify:FL=1
MFDPEKCEHVPMNHQKSEAEIEIDRLKEENELLRGCIMEICDVVFSE